MFFRSALTATLILAAASLMAALPSPTMAAKSDIKIKQKTVYYTISGRTPEAFFKSLSKSAPFLKGSQALGISRLKFNSNIKGIQTENTCRVDNPQVNLEVVMTLPRWRDEKRADPRLQLFWKAFSAFVRKHEEKHVSIAMKHARQLQQVYSRIPAAPNCKLLKARLNSGARRILTQHHNAQTKFDAREQAKLRGRSRAFTSGRNSRRNRGYESN